MKESMLMQDLVSKVGKLSFFLIFKLSNKFGKPTTVIHKKKLLD